MSIQDGGNNPNLSIGSNQRELKLHGTPEFPCAGYTEYYTPDSGHSLPWHWHDEMEIIYILSGAMTAETPGRLYELAEGDCIVFNAGVLHSGTTDSFCEICSSVFDASLIFGSKESVFAKKYILPLINCHAFRGCKFDRKSEAGAIQSFLELYSALAKEPPGYEFIVREKLSDICFALYRRFEPGLQSPNVPRYDQNELRIQRMLAFIHENFACELSLADIARAADIGERECLRCFRKTIRISPMQYLLRYRVTQGAQALLARPTDSIAQIAAACGFDSPSNFSQQFRRFYICTPREYRANAAQPGAGPDSIL